MKSLTTLILVLTFGAIALANTEPDVQIDVIEMGVFLDSSNEYSSDSTQIHINTKEDIARLYKFKNSRVKKALSFVTKQTSSKWV